MPKPVGTIGISVHDDWQGKGVGTALMRAGLDLASRQHAFRDGHYVDSKMMARLRPSSSAT